MFKYSILFLFIFFFSCSNGNKIKKTSSNNFLAYYNTFYMAEKYFNDALEIIQLNESEDNSIPSQALTLLDDAIQNALIIEEKFYNTKYLDDAYFILGKSSYLIDRITAANYYFEKLCEPLIKIIKYFCYSLVYIFYG